MTAKAMRIHQYGGPDVLHFEDVDIADPRHGEIRIAHTAIGLNFIDIYQRTGLYKLPSLPAVLGQEGAGVVTALGDGATDLRIGDRVAYAGCLGSYATERIIPADRVVKIPNGISDQTAAAIMLKGMTTRMLFRETYAVRPDTVMLFHAAAGGVGLLACQWARAIGATMIGTTSTAAKAEVARAFGCTHVVAANDPDFVERVRALTGGKGCDVVFDSVGRDTYEASLACLKPRGLWVSFGNASGPVPPFDLTLLKGSIFATRPSLFAYTALRHDLLANANELFAMVLKGHVKNVVQKTYALSDAAMAQQDLSDRQTTGSIVLIP